MSDQRNSQSVNQQDIATGMGELAQRAAMKPEIMEIMSPDGVRGQCAVIPAVEGGRQTVRLESVSKFYDENRTKPVSRKGTAKLGDFASLVAHINRFKDADSVVFASTDREAPAITAMLDYHLAGAESSPRFGHHRSHYDFPLSSEWKAWVSVNGRELSMAAFAEFIEGHMVDVVEGKLAASVNLTNGIKQIQFEEKHTGANGDPLKVPGAFLIGIPVFRGGDRFQVCVRLRYRKQGGSLTWIMELWRHEEVFDAAIKDTCDKVQAATGLPLLVGSPE